jgi:hypothetical protein
MNLIVLHDIQFLCLKNHQTATDRPDLVARVFRIKLRALMADLTIGGVLGRVVAHIHEAVFGLGGFLFMSWFGISLYPI